MTAAREFLDWNQPALPAVADWLVAAHAKGGVLDLSGLVAVLPGSRAGRRLLELLVDRADEGALRLVPPEITTVGHLPEQLYISQKPFAEDLTQRLAWVQALREADGGTLEEILRDRPDDDDERGWTELADLLRRQHRELAGDGLHFGDVADCGLLEELPRERRRWEALRSIQLGYLTVLEQLGLWDKQTARLVAIDNDECEATRDIVLVGSVDINQAGRQMLEAPRVVGRVTALIHAPHSLDDHFDELGCLRPDHWQRPAVAVPPAAVSIADRPDDQAAAVAAWLADLPNPPRADDITIGVGDESLVPALRRQMADSGVASRWVHEVAMAETRPWTLLEAIAACLASWQQATGESDEDDDAAGATVAYPELAALFRHPDFDAWLSRQVDAGDHPSDWIAELDHYRGEHVPARIGQWRGKPETYQRLRDAFAGTVSLLSPLAGPPRPLPEWTPPLLEVLETIYDGVEAHREDRDGHVLLRSARYLHAALGISTKIPTSLAPTVGCPRAIQLALESAGGETIAALPGGDAIELVGWLELPLDDAPVLAVTGMNEGHVPKSATSDLFLPDRLRRELGILHNGRRIARDAYAVSVLVASRDRLLLVGGRRSDTADPLRPSRLLLAAGPDGQAHRVLQLLDTPPADRAARLPGAFATGPEQSSFLVPPPVTGPGAVTKASVTAFRDWLACPYLFYLKHVLELEAVAEGPDELTALTFGSLAHDTLDAFGKSELAGSDDLAAVRDELQRTLWQQLGRRHGSHRPEAIELQVGQLTRRLDAFADWQVASVSEGWQIAYTEESIKKGQSTLTTPAGILSITGRIDRIDRHEESGTWRVIDYKTGNKATTPDKQHRSRGRWTDLQLPLYLHLVRDVLDLEGEITLGFVVLPAIAAQAGFLAAEWTEAELEEAEAAILEAAEGMLRGEFGNVAQSPPLYSDDFHDLCQVGLPHPPRHEHWSVS